MKTIQKWNGLLLSVVIPVILLCAACSDPVTDKEDNGKDTTHIITGDEADRIFESFKFRNGLKVTGSVPSVVNTSLVKTDSRDTIYTMPGLQIPIRISHPASAVVNGWFITVKNSTFYYDVPLDEVEDSDTVSVVIVGIDPGDIEVPYDIPVEITPYNGNKEPIDIIDRIITVENPSAGGCDILVEGDTANDLGIFEWLWKSTVVFDTHDEPTFVNAPSKVFAADQQIEGCCDTLACPQAVYNPITKATELVFDTKVSAATSYTIYLELFNFFKDGTFTRVTSEGIKNFSYKATNWCNGVPGYNDRQSDVWYYGTHDYVPGNTRISYGTNRSICDDPLGICGYGSRPGALTHSCHLMVITAGSEGSKEVRIYARHPYSEVWAD